MHFRLKKRASLHIRLYCLLLAFSVIAFPLHVKAAQYQSLVNSHSGYCDSHPGISNGNIHKLPDAEEIVGEVSPAPVLSFICAVKPQKSSRLPLPPPEPHHLSDYSVPNLGFRPPPAA